MTQAQFLIALIALIPFANALIAKFCDDSSKLVSLIEKMLPVLFSINLVGIYGNLARDNSYLVISEATRGVAIGFDIDHLGLVFLFLLNFIWIVFAFYSQKFLRLLEVKNSADLKLFLALIIAFINLIILGKNLLTILFFYNCLIILCHFFGLKFLHKKETKFSTFFTFLLYLESLFLFLAIVATYKFMGQVDFAANGIISGDIDSAKYGMILVCYLVGLFLSVLVPFYLLYRDINLDLITIYSLFFLSYAFVSIYILLKVLYSIFGIENFALIFSGIGFAIFEWLFLFNIAVAGVCVIVSKGIKSSFFYLFFQQFSFVIFSIFLFATFDESKISMAILSFVFSITLIFFCISNFILYLGKAENKSMVGLFYDLKISTILLIFALANLMGIAPGVGAVEKFFLLKVIFKQKLIVSAVIILVNFVTLAAFAWKAILPFFYRPEEARSQTDQELAKSIDFDSSLILTAFTTAVAIVLSLIFSPFLIKFL
jgi:formate hydrogenlyase subunit 3/multisubunit Na+/H+ antiporter MnhD subunit